MLQSVIYHPRWGEACIIRLMAGSPQTWGDCLDTLLEHIAKLPNRLSLYARNVLVWGLMWVDLRVYLFKISHRYLWLLVKVYFFFLCMNYCLIQLLMLGVNRLWKVCLLNGGLASNDLSDFHRRDWRIANDLGNRRLGGKGSLNMVHDCLVKKMFLVWVVGLKDALV